MSNNYNIFIIFIFLFIYTTSLQASVDIKKLSKNKTVYNLLKDSHKLKEISNLPDITYKFLADNVLLRAMSRFFINHYKEKLDIDDENKMYEKVLFIASNRDKIKKLLQDTLKQEYKNLELLLSNNFTKDDIKDIKKIYQSKLSKEFVKSKNKLLNINNYNEPIKQRLILFKQYKNSKKLPLIIELCKIQNPKARFCMSKDFMMIYLDVYKNYNNNILNKFILFAKQKRVVKLNCFIDQWFRKSYMKTFEKLLLSHLISQS